MSLETLSSLFAILLSLVCSYVLALIANQSTFLISPKPDRSNRSGARPAPALH